MKAKGKQTEINANERYEARITNHKTHNNMTNHFLFTSRNVLVRVLETDKKHFFGRFTRTANAVRQTSNEESSLK